MVAVGLVLLIFGAVGFLFAAAYVLYFIRHHGVPPPWREGFK